MLSSKLRILFLCTAIATLCLIGFFVWRLYFSPIILTQTNQNTTSRSGSVGSETSNTTGNQPSTQEDQPPLIPSGDLETDIRNAELRGNVAPDSRTPQNLDTILKKYGTINFIHQGIIAGYNVIGNGTSPAGQQYTIVLYLNKNFATKEEAINALSSSSFGAAYDSIRGELISNMTQQGIKNPGSLLDRIIFQKDGQDITSLVE